MLWCVGQLWLGAVSIWVYEQVFVGCALVIGKCVCGGSACMFVVCLVFSVL